jgi:hypothetical protein
MHVHIRASLVCASWVPWLLHSQVFTLDLLVFFLVCGFCFLFFLFVCFASDARAEFLYTLSQLSSDLPDAANAKEQDDDDQDDDQFGGT